MTFALDPNGYLPEPPGPRPIWTWRLEDATGTVVSSATAEAAGAALPGGVLAFTSRGDAESWLGETWRDLAGDGVHAATLFSEDRLVEGPIRLAG